MASTRPTRTFDFEGLLLSLEHGAPQTVLASSESGVVPFVLASIRHRLERPLIVVVPDAERARAVAEAMSAFEAEQWPALQPVLPFFANDVSPYHEIAPVRALAAERVAAAYRLSMDLGVAAVVMPAEALLLQTLDGPTLDASAAMASAGANLDRVELAELLVAGGYERVPVVEDSGTFCIRGGVVDIWSPLYDRPVRLDFFGDDVETIRFFDPATQQGGSHLPDAIFPPARELLLDPDKFGEIADRITDLADDQGLGTTDLRAIVDELRSGHLMPGLEALLPAVSPGLAPILTTAEGVKPIVVLEGPDACYAAIEETYKTLRKQYRDARNAGRLATPPATLFCSPVRIRKQLEATTRLLIRPVAMAEDAGLPTFRLDVQGNSDITDALRREKGSEEGLRPLAARIREARRMGHLVAITSRGAGGRDRLAHILKHYGIAAVTRDEPLRPSDMASLRQQKDVDAVLILGGSGRGFLLEALHLLLIDEQEIFGTRSSQSRKRTSKQAAGQLIRDVTELKEGDYVVHTDHGVGRYAHMRRMAAGGTEQDYLVLLYRGEERVYVPATALDKVQKFVGGGSSPHMDKLGNERWARVKSKTRKAVETIAVELVKLYAERQAQPGYAFSRPGELYREWEATFPHNETADQQRAIDDVIEDMCAPRPAWRLVCGDVGYGKTEVAIRAAVKACLDNKQVAVLVPTTVLAEQHRLTFSQRLHGLPIEVDSLSRFRTSAEQREVMDRMSKGTLDIVVGTHRLLSKDIKFRDLGLLIVDEEHRFGVKQKEAISKWRATLDCIVLTATPIPRTLQMATLGLRDLSLIATPPENRKAVRTIVCRGSDELIKESIDRELARGGQVFYIRNRVGDLAKIAEDLVVLCPKARPVVAHGQMSETDLEAAMLGFMGGEFNVLVATTIVESGLDIPNANTMFIERADTFGLAQLYQLRGRVGRASQRAYCYLMIPPRQHMTDDGAKRVAVLERFSELGSGVHIASHDLEIRGAGNILGEAQSGHIAEVGYDLYVRMLEEAVNELREDFLGAPVDPEIKVQVTAYLPDTWIPDASQRLMAYKRLASVRTEEELSGLVDHLVDRFGKLPEAAHSLVDTIEIRVLAIELGVAKVEQGPAAIALTLHERGRLQAQTLLPLINTRGSLYRITPDMVLLRPLRPSERDDALQTTKAVLRDLIRHAMPEPAVTIDIS